MRNLPTFLTELSLAAWFVLVCVGWLGGVSAARSASRLALAMVLIASSGAGLARWFSLHRGGQRTPARRTGPPLPADRVPAQEFRFRYRLRASTIQAVMGAGLVCVSLYLFGRTAARPSDDVAVYVFGSTSGAAGLLLLWSGWRAFVARVRTGPAGLGIQLMITHRTVAWEELTGFERVEVPVGNGNWQPYLRIVTAVRSYLIPDRLEDRAGFIAAVSRATGLVPR